MWLLVQPGTRIKHSLWFEGFTFAVNTEMNGQESDPHPDLETACFNPDCHVPHTSLIKQLHHWQAVAKQPATVSQLLVAAKR